MTGAGVPVPVTPARLAGWLAELVAGEGAGHRWLVVGVDGAPAAAPTGLADALVAPLRALGRPVERVRAGDFLRPASLRLEHGRTDSASYRTGWLDVAGLRREVLEPFAAGGRYLPSLWDAARDRATREAAVDAPAGAVLVVDGTFLLGRGLPFDLAVHVRLGPGALRRRTPESLRWTLPAYDGYAGEAYADVVVRLDDPAHPAVTCRR